MDDLTRLAQIATQLHQEEADVIPPAPFHARNTLRFHERAYYILFPRMWQTIRRYSIKTPASVAAQSIFGYNMRAEVVEFRKFLQQHTKEQIRQGVLHRDEIGMQFLTLQKKALQRCNTVPASKTTSARPATSR